MKLKLINAIFLLIIVIFSTPTRAIEMGGSAGCIVKINFLIENTSNDMMKNIVRGYFSSSIPNFYGLLNEINVKYEGFEDMAVTALTTPPASEIFWMETFNCARQLELDGYLKPMGR